MGFVYHVTPCGFPKVQEPVVPKGPGVVIPLDRLRRPCWDLVVLLKSKSCKEGHVGYHVVLKVRCPKGDPVDLTVVKDPGSLEAGLLVKGSEPEGYRARRVP